ncbi:MAG: hypothetical protein HRT57_01995 [Crocinitomicaceae bacterium]|nr:hypothetical protein [Crocinitomicaceae bacterium]
MKEIPAYKVTLFVIGILALLLTVTFFVPDDGYDIKGHKMKFLTLEDFIEPPVQENADLKDVLVDLDTAIVDDPLTVHSNGSNGDFGAPNAGDINVNAKTKLQFNEAGEKNLHSFFRKLNSVAANRKKMSILHYGDSQIEGDRMTSYIRQKIQNQFGGNGPGLIPATNVYNTFAFKQTYSENFKRYTCFGGQSLKSNKYGVMASASRFTPEIEIDSTTNLDSMLIQTGWIEIGPSSNAYTRTRQFNNVRMHYNSCLAPTKLSVYQDENLIHEEQLNLDGAQHSVLLTFNSTPGKLKYEFTGKVSPNICAFSLEGDYGVQVSNIGMRGSSGTVFGRINQTVLKAMYSELNTELVIMQFGGNSVPFFKDSTGVDNFASYFKSQIYRVKKLNPGAMVIVIGPSDMSKLELDIYETYKFLPYLVRKMREETIDTGSAFWNLYGAMGGKNSMPAWVEKGLAGGDHIHFSNGGAKIASQFFYEALISEFSKWKNEH